MHHHDAAAVNALPQPHGERILLSAGIEGIVPPSQLLGGETDKPAMAGQGRKVIAEAEAVGQKNIGALLAELLPVECLAKQYIAYPRLRRANHGLVGIPRTAGKMPAPCGHIFFYLLIFQRIVFFHPPILHASLKVENIIGIGLQQMEVLRHRLPNVILDGGLHVPVPLRVEVGVGYHVGL